MGACVVPPQRLHVCSSLFLVRYFAAPLHLLLDTNDHAPHHLASPCARRYPPCHAPPDTPFEDLPDGWVCPQCGAAKSEYVRVLSTSSVLGRAILAILRVHCYCRVICIGADVCSGLYGDIRYRYFPQSLPDGATVWVHHDADGEAQPRAKDQRSARPRGRAVKILGPS